jgi:hypothetical protein
MHVVVAMVMRVARVVTVAVRHAGGMQRRMGGVIEFRVAVGMLPFQGGFAATAYRTHRLVSCSGRLSIDDDGCRSAQPV